MTEKSPEVLATANLTPISPSPLHISSPILIPSLQDQADSLSTMTLPTAHEAFTASTAGTEFAKAGQSSLPTFNIQTDTHHSDAAMSEESDLYDDNDELDTKDQKEEVALVEEKDGNVQQFTDQDAMTKAQKDVSKTHESSPSSDTSLSLTIQSQATVSSHDVSANPAQSVHQPVQNTQTTNQSAAEDVQEPRQLQKTQEHAVVNSTHAPQPTDAPTENSDHGSNAPNDEIDIQVLVDKIIGNASSNNDSQTSAPQNLANPPSSAPAVSLPPRPPMPQQPAFPYVRPEDAHNYQQGTAYPSVPMASSMNPPPPGIYSAGAPGTTQEHRNNIATPPSSVINTLPAHPYPAAKFESPYASNEGTPFHVADQSRGWETFLQEERRFASEAKWDRFPEGSRLFIGNLSSDRVSKREVYDLFAPYGHLAQISLKQAYGFVQYHSLAEGEAAMRGLQGKEVQGRKIHLEFSRTQRKDGDGDKRDRGNKNRRENDRHDGGRGRRDDYRPGRQSSPRRGNHRQGAHDTNRGYKDDYGSRARSRSPGYGRRDSDHYRRRSPEPYRRQPQSSEADLNIPRRYGGDVPDVQFLLLHEVGRDFISWVEKAFIKQGLSVQVMFLSPRYPHDAVVHRQAVEGVHAVVEIDYKAQQTGFISLQVFDRSAGHYNVRYDQYQELDPNVAASLVSRTKSQFQAQARPPSHAQQPPYGAQYPPAPQYGQAPPPQPPYHPAPYTNQPYPGAYPGTYPGVGAPPNNSDAAIQHVLRNLHGPQGHSQNPVPGYQSGGASVDVNQLLASMGGTNAIGPLGTQRNGGYPPTPINGAPGAPTATSGESSRHVQDIMAQLEQFRQ